jgi:hypothetical protein
MMARWIWNSSPGSPAASALTGYGGLKPRHEARARTFMQSLVRDRAQWGC